MRFYISQEKIEKIKLFFKHYIKFLLAGVPSLIIALPLNLFLVESLGFNKAFSYGLVLCLQITLNFFVLKKYVFKASNKRNFVDSFLKFFAGIAIFRLIDWILYSFIVSFFPGFYILIQLSNVIIFSSIKFRYSKNVI
tara:strand:+ start:10992 stop:11405 length:414 start_codon:yes stop_codon:yes gene_type:complete